jgi:type IV pilus assembly protein PilC
VADRVQEHIESGSSLASALDGERAYFPPIFLAMTEVGEETGNLPEVFAELEKYFRLQQGLRRQFLSQIFWPVLQFVAAIFVVAGMLWILGLIASFNPGTKPFDPLGLGLTGTDGAIKFLLIVFGTLGLLFAGYLLATRALRQKAAVDAFLLRLPVVGPCLRALALSRFCMALRLTTETGMPIARALRLTFRSTGNEAFVARTPVVEDAVKRGEELTTALTATRLFPGDFLNIMAVAEESGRLSEVMAQQAEHYQEESGRRLTILTQVASWGVWLVVAILIIIVIFRIALVYIGLLDPDHPMYKM